MSITIGAKDKSLVAQYTSLLKASWHFAGHKRWRMLCFYAMFLTANILYMFQPYVIGQFINQLQVGGDDLLENITHWLGIYVLLMAGFWAFHGPARVMERRLAFHVKKSFYKYCYQLVMHFPLHWHRDNQTGNTINRINKAASALYNFSDGQFFYFEGVLRFVIVIAMLAWTELYVGLFMFAFSFVVLFVVRKFDRVIIKKSHESNEMEHKFSSHFYDYVSNVDNVSLFNLKGHSKAQLYKDIKALYPPLKGKINATEWKWFSLMFLMVIGQFSVLYGYIYYHIETNQVVMIGTLVAIFQYLVRMDGVISGIAWVYQSLIQQATDIASIDPILKQAPDTEEETGKAHLKVTQGTIKFDNTQFSYNENISVFKGLNLGIHAKERVGIVGHSGAGKTTLVHLLMRFFDHDGKDILIDGQKIGDCNIESLRQNIAVIPQDTTLFQTSLLENIRYGRLGATDEEVFEAAQKAYCHEFIDKLPNKYDTNVGERGVKLSGGQRQRIAIARAILKDAPILILDEATSALDTESEFYIQKSLKQLMSEKTVLAIAHRLSTISHMDRIVVLEGGQVIEQGAHDDLLAQQGRYAKLWKMQSDGFLLGE